MNTLYSEPILKKSSYFCCYVSLD